MDREMMRRAPSMLCIVCAAFVAFSGNAAFGWFLFVAWLLWP
jgi:hypothetical protein